MNHTDQPGLSAQPEGADVHALSGAYAVDALDDLERARFEAHLKSCADCRDEVAGLRETAALLGSADVVAPPPSLRASILDQIESVRPLPPEIPAMAPADSTVTPIRARRFPTMLVAAAAVILIAAAGALWLRPWADDSTPVTLTATERVLDAADATRVHQKFPDGAVATVVRSRSVGRAVLLTQDMVDAPKGKDYQLWLQTPDGEMVPAGLMPDDPDATVLLDGDAAKSTAVGITIEPDGGSPQPTSNPIAVLPLDS